MDRYLWKHIHVFRSRDDLLNVMETSQSTQRASGSDQAGLTNLEPILTSAHTEAKKKPASNSFPYLPTGTDASPAPTEGMILPDADSGPTPETQPALVELSGQVGELAAELGV